jgi:prepilin-type N-terminal cleavage/methylation domain-containing protein
MTDRRGLTLVELLISSAILAMMAAALGTLALTVAGGNQYSRGQGAAAQHARVALERIRTACLEAHASEQFPGFLVVSETSGGWSFPDTLVVWRAANPADPQGLPLFRELVIFAPDPAAPNRLLEITAPSDGRQVPSPGNAAAWRTEIAALMGQSTTQSSQLTDLMRTPQTDSGTRRAAVRFHVLSRPSDDDRARVEKGELAWSELPWAQSIRGTQLGLRQTWCRIELQLMPGPGAATADPEGETAVTFFGSAAIYYGMIP